LDSRCFMLSGLSLLLEGFAVTVVAFVVHVARSVLTMLPPSLELHPMR